MSQKPAPRTPPRFDLQRFDTMAEPFIVRVDKFKGTTKYEIPLPEQEGSAPGTGWSKEQVRGLESWMVKEWAGGGHYFFAIVDASQQLMEWTAYYPTTEFPEKVPPTLQGAYALPPPIGSSTPVNQRVQMAASFPGNGPALPPGSPFAAPMPAAMPAPSYPHGFGYAPGYQQAYAYPPPFAQPTAPSNEAQALREQLNNERQLAQQRDFDRRVEAMKAESDQKIAALQAQFASMIDKLGEKLTGPRAGMPDPMLVQLQEQNRILQEQVRRQAEENDRNRREAELRDQITRSAEETRRLVDEANRRTEAMMREITANKAPDQQLIMFQTMFNAQTETMKEIARNSQMQIERMQSNALRPQDVLAIAKDASSSTDVVASNIARQYEAMFGIQRQLIEQAAQLNQGGGNEVIGLVRDGASALSGMAEKYLGQKSKEQIAQVNAQATIAQSQAEVAKVAQERLASMAAMEHAVRNGQAVQMPDGSFRAPGAPPQAALGSPSGGTIVTPPPAWVPPGMRKPTAPAAAPANDPPSNVVPINGAQADARKVKGRSDLEWFGGITPMVRELRDEVAKFLAALGETPPRRDGASPAEVATAIGLAAQQLMERQIAIPAMVELLMQGMVADFLDVLLPDAPQSYRDDVVRALTDVEEDEDPDPEDEDEHEQGQPNA